MNWKSVVLLIVISSIFVLGSIAGIVCYAKSPLLRGDIDGLLLVAICILMGTIFSVQLFSIYRTLMTVRSQSRAAATKLPWKEIMRAALADVRIVRTRPHN